MNLRAFLSAVAAIAAFALPSLAFGDTVVYDQPYNTIASFVSDVSPEQAYDNFTLASAATVSGVTWDGTYFSSQPTAFTINFLSDNAGSPGALIASDVVSGNPVDTGSNTYGYEIYSYSASISPVFFDASTQYWIDIIGNTNNNWMWSTADGGDGIFYLNQTQATFGPGYDLAFGLTSTPEPSGLVLLATGLVAALAFGRHRLLRV